jgi:hypothetical protein
MKRTDPRSQIQLLLDRMEALHTLSEPTEPKKNHVASSCMCIESTRTNTAQQAQKEYRSLLGESFEIKRSKPIYSY